MPKRPASPVFAGNYYIGNTPITLHPGDTLTYRLAVPSTVATTSATTMTTTYSYTFTPNSGGTFYGGWWTQPQPSQPPLWAPQIGTAPTTVPNTPPPGTPWLQPTIAPPPEPQELDAVVKKQIEDARLSPHVALVGYRAWQVDLNDEDGPKLQSLISPVKWPYRQELRAHRLDTETPPLHWSAPNGIHAARSVEHLMKLGYGHTAMLTGEVYLWGRVIHGKLGYRAEKAYPKVIRSQRNHWWLKVLAERYGIPYEITSPDESA